MSTINKMEQEGKCRGLRKSKKKLKLGWEFTLVSCRGLRIVTLIESRVGDLEQGKR